MDEPSLPQAVSLTIRLPEVPAAPTGVEGLIVIERKIQFFHCGVRLQQQRKVWAQLVPLISSPFCLHACACPSVSWLLTCGILWLSLDGAWSNLGQWRMGGTARALRAFPTQTTLWFCLAPTSVRSRHLRLQSDIENSNLCHSVQVLEHTVWIQVNTL